MRYILVLACLALAAEAQGQTRSELRQRVASCEYALARADEVGNRRLSELTLEQVDGALSILAQYCEPLSAEIARAHGRRVISFEERVRMQGSLENLLVIKARLQGHRRMVLRRGY